MEMEEERPLKAVDHCMYSAVHCTEQKQIHFDHTDTGSPAMKASIPPWLDLAPRHL